MSTLREQIEEKEKELEQLKELERLEEQLGLLDDSENLLIKETLNSAKEKYLGKSICINNEESGIYFIRTVADIRWMDDMLVFLGSGVFIDLQISSIDLNLENMEAPAIYSNPEYYNYESWITVYSNASEARKDFMNCISFLVEESLS